MILTILTFLTRMMHLILGIGTPQNFPPPLSQKEEKDYFLKMEAGDKEARQQLILHNLRLVSHVVRKYYSGAKNQEDLVSIGTIGLIKAIDSFNIHNGARFATYGARCIQNEILMHFRSQKKFSSEVSINETIDIDRDGNPLTYMDVISADEDVAEDIQRKILTEKMMEQVNFSLSGREKQILRMRYGLSGEEALTQRQVAESLGISRSYVSRIEKSALQKLKDALK